MRTWSTLKKLIWLKKGIMKAASWVWKTVTGSILHITDALAGDVSALSVAINPVQSGSGDPSPDNVRPISGWTQAKITRTGKNLFDNAHAPYYGRYISYTSPTSAEWRTSGDSASYCIPVKPNTKYAIKPHATTAVFRVCAISTDPATIGSATVQSVNAYSQNASGNFYCTITTGPNERWLVIQCGKSVTEGRTGMVMVELGNGYSEYEDYQGVSVTIDLDGTVYGGTLDVLTGVLTVTKGFVDLGELNWTVGTGNFNILSSAALPNVLVPTAANTDPNALCSVYPVLSYNQSKSTDKSMTIIYQSSFAAGKVWVRDSSYSDASAFKTDMSGMLLVYPLAAPQTIQLTPETLSTLLGENNIWADAGDVSVTYRADTTLYIQKLTGPTEDDMIADTNIANGQYFMVGNRLFLATAAIAAGAALTVGTNCTETNLAAALNALNS